MKPYGMRVRLTVVLLSEMVFFPFMYLKVGLKMTIVLACVMQH